MHNHEHHASTDHKHSRDHKHYLPGFGHDALIPFYDIFSRLMGVDSFHRLLVEQADITPGQRILEIGCGTGNLTLRIKRQHPSADVAGIDPDPLSLERAGKKARRAKLSVDWHRGFAQQLPFPDGTFDKVFSSLMFHHLEPDNQKATLDEVRRVLAPGGTLHLADFGSSDDHSVGIVSRRAREDGRLRPNFGAHIPKLMQESGFVGASEVDHRVSRFIGRITFYRAAAPDLNASEPTSHSEAHRHA